MHWQVSSVVIRIDLTTEDQRWTFLDDKKRIQLECLSFIQPMLFATSNYTLKHQSCLNMLVGLYKV